MKWFRENFLFCVAAIIVGGLWLTAWVNAQHQVRSVHVKPETVRRAYDNSLGASFNGPEEPMLTHEREAA